MDKSIEQYQAEKRELISKLSSQQIGIMFRQIEVTKRYIKLCRRPMIARCDRRPGKIHEPMEFVASTFESLLKIRSLQTRKQIIASAPIPKFPSGTFQSGIVWKNILHEQKL